MHLVHVSTRHARGGIGNSEVLSEEAVSSSVGPCSLLFTVGNNNQVHVITRKTEGGPQWRWTAATLYPDEASD